MDSDAKILLDDTISFCKSDGQDDRLLNMLSQSRAISLDDDTLTIEAPSRFSVSYLTKKKELIESYVEKAAFAPIYLKVLEPTRDTLTSSQEAENVSPSSLSSLYKSGDHSHTFWTNENNQAGIRVKNTIGKDEFNRMIGRESSQTKEDLHPEYLKRDVYPSVSINSKFTFATFVYGDENKHAYHSAQRFAAFADEPGQSNSLFIYGGSGLGKTHLLLAIKNYLTDNKPHIKVKYSNSQAFIDDFIIEVNLDKNAGRTILRDYHEADVLIIDDIQNIIGKQASIDYFFRLMEEFIAANKKIAIASDRAPKKLALDERMTSRFNAGMLCLVSEPGFEMKYAILKRYYESIIQGSGSPTLNIDASLLNSFPLNEGRLTDEQLRHMAEISGNNIRELESFCERCTSLSYEREQAGGELSAEDIEKVANEYFDTAHKIIHIDTIQSVIEEFYHVSHEDLIGPKRQHDIAFARHMAIYLSNSLCDLSSKAIGEEFGGRDHSTVINSLKVVESKMKEDRRICEDLQQLKNKITLRS